MYFYFVYGYKLASNIAFENVPAYGSQPCGNGVFYLDFRQKAMASSTWAVSLASRGGEYILSLGDSVRYCLDPAKKEMTAYAPDPSYVESTMLNLPFAVVAAARGSLLLHASVLAYKNTLIPIFARKGTGKTTLAASMSRFFPLFSDDTLYVKPEGEDVRLYAGSEVLKMHKDSSSVLGMDAVSDRVNIQKKGYYRSFRSVGGVASAADCRLGACFFLKREKRSDLAVEEITGRHLKKMALHANICGAETLGFAYCTRIQDSPLFDKILSESAFYKLAIPDDFDRLPAISEELAEFIERMPGLG